ncbi:MAG TPA: LysR family transcriptional regulator [Sphingobium sp.]|uniref:LysR family transcriptional regulator n=1 Tax=Sphingobium sp. TaxID=1912891 RepID=UPI002ED1129B
MLDLRALTYLVTLARRANYARAADDLGISQPALTRAIQSLERQLGMRLFDRDRSGVNPTPQGRVFIDRAAVLVANADDLERQTQLTADGREGVVRFGMAPMPARALLSATLSRRLAEAQAMINDVVVRNVEALWPLLTAGEIEFFVSAEGQVPDASSVRAEPLGHFPTGLIVRRGHPLLDGAHQGETFPVLLSSRMGGVLLDMLPASASRSPHCIEDFETLSALTASSDAIWVNSSFAAARECEAGVLQELPFPEADAPRRMRIMMYSLERRTLSPAARSLKQELRRQIAILAKRAGKQSG